MTYEYYLHILVVTALGWIVGYAKGSKDGLLKGAEIVGTTSNVANNVIKALGGVETRLDNLESRQGRLERTVTHVANGTLP